MLEPANLSDLVASAVQQASEQSGRLGVSWSLRQGTVLQSVPPNLVVAMDGDTDDSRESAIRPVPLCGIPGVGARVMLLVIPDAVFILSVIGGQTSSRLVDEQTGICSADLALGTGAADLVGAAVSVFGAGHWSATAVADVQVGTASTAVAIIDLTVDGSLVSGELHFSQVTSAGRATVAQIWQGNFNNSRNHTFKLQARKTAALGAITVMQNHTKLRVASYS